MTTALDWDLHKELITELYADHELKDVMETMRVHHNFKATPKQYKTLFTRWHLDKKNIKTNEYKAMLKKQRARERDNPDCSTEFTLHGQVVPAAKIERFESRMLQKGVISEMDMFSDIDTPRSLAWRSPSPVNFNFEDSSQGPAQAFETSPPSPRETPSSSVITSGSPHSLIPCNTLPEPGSSPQSFNNPLLYSTLLDVDDMDWESVVSALSPVYPTLNTPFSLSPLYSRFASPFDFDESNNFTSPSLMLSVEHSFAWSPLPPSGIQFHFPPSSPTSGFMRPKKRFRALEDVGSWHHPMEPWRLERKKRRLRLLIVTSRLSPEFSFPASNIVNPRTFKTLTHERLQNFKGDLLRKVAIRNSWRLRATARDIEHPIAASHSALNHVIGARVEVEKEDELQSYMARYIGWGGIEDSYACFGVDKA